MPSYTVCIVEDNAECAAALIDRVAASPFSEGLVIHEMASRAELESFVSEGRAIDILITDINLGTDAADGISMVRDLFPVGSKTQVIYATGYIEYCTPVYETQHVYFLVKPVRQSTLDDALNMDARDASVVLHSEAALSAASPLCESAALSSDRA